VLLTGSVVSSAGSLNVLVRDLSAAGSQVYAEGLSPGDASFIRGPLFVAARVTWCRKGVAGLAFYRELTPFELESAFPSALSETSEEPVASVYKEV
jgi:hypothetical protein